MEIRWVGRHTKIIIEWELHSFSACAGRLLAWLHCSAAPSTVGTSVERLACPNSAPTSTSGSPVHENQVVRFNSVIHVRSRVGDVDVRFQWPERGPVAECCRVVSARLARLHRACPTDSASVSCRDTGKRKLEKYKMACAMCIVYMIRV